MTAVEIHKLFDDERLPEGLELFLLFIYFPFGVILLLLRIFIGLHVFLVACILPKMSIIRSVVLRTMCAVLGIVVTREGKQHRCSKVKVMVANYTSALDHLAVDLVMPCILPSVWDLPPALMWILGYKDLGAKEGRETLIRNAKAHYQSSPVPFLVFPEGASTNGKEGLLKFSTWPFSLEETVQPILIKLSRPIAARISPSILGGRWWIDVFWFLFVPYTHFNIRVLPPLDADGFATSEEFTRDTQKLMARELGVLQTQHTSNDKVEYVKRKLFLQPAPASQEARSPIDVMALQVREVLPHVPIHPIKADLTLTRDVDLTITNILEGRVEFVPDDEISNLPSTRTVAKTPVQAPTSKSVPNSALHFEKTSKQRELSFDERKKQLIETAKQRYMAKHNLI